MIIQNLKITFQKLIRKNATYINLKHVLSEPPLPKNVPKDSIWHSGEGAGSWFYFCNEDKGLFNVKRYSSDGLIEANGIYVSNIECELNLKNIKINYPSNCAEINLSIGNTKCKLIYCGVSI